MKLKAALRIAKIWSIIGIATLVVTPFFYLLYNGFGEQGEVTFSAVSWLAAHGHPLYIGLNSADRYSLEHGPIVYLVVGGIMKTLGPGYTTAKLAAFAALLLALAFSWLLYRKSLGKADSLLLLGMEAWLFLHWPYAYFVRPDALMFLSVVVGLYIATAARSRWLIILGTAVALGFITNLKIHGGFYLLPVLFLVYQRLGLRDVVLICGIALLLSILPFLLPQISLANYFLWLFEAVHHGFRWHNIVAKILIMSEFFLLPVAVGTLCGLDLGNFYRRYKGIILALLLSMIVPVIIGSKAGSGSYHLIPFTPVAMYILMLFVAHIREREVFLPEMAKSQFAVKASGILVVLIALSLTLAGLNGERRIIRHMTVGDRTAITRDLRAIEAKYAGRTIEIGPCDNASVLYRDLIPLPVFRGNPYLIDVVAMDDMQSSGLRIPPATVKKLKEGEVAVWLIPKGQKPFFSGLFDGPFRQTFLEYYHKEATTKYFDIWVYKHANMKLSGNY